MACEPLGTRLQLLRVIFLAAFRADVARDEVQRQQRRQGEDEDGSRLGGSADQRGQEQGTGRVSGVDDVVDGEIVSSAPAIRRLY